MTRRNAVAALTAASLTGCMRPGGWGRSLKRPASLSLTAPAQFTVLFETTKGNFEVECIRDWSPLGADRFYNLVRYRFYDGVRFFRVLPNFVVQFGISPDPEIAKPWDKAVIQDDPVKQSNTRGMISFATGGPNTRTTQIFINKGNNARLDARGFSPFARVSSGMSVIDALEARYGEGAPRGKGPDQDKMRDLGDAYIAKDYPFLDRVIRARIIRQSK